MVPQYFLIFLCAAFISVECILVAAPCGRMTGLSYQNGEQCHAEFLGIPYAQQPIGALRFQPPLRLAPWNGVLAATQPGPYCPQPPMPYPAPIDEACLQLNVYAPCLNNTTLRANLPVMVWVHGGGYSIGSAVEKMYNGSSLAGGVVVVTVNYRLGFLGFSSLGDAGSDTNYGLLDQQMALIWVRTNIAAFGGDPSKVTLFGESAGSFSIGLHYVMESSKGLFSGGIMESGNPLGVQSYEYSLEKSLPVIKALGCEDPSTRVRCLQQLSWQMIVNVSTHLCVPSLHCWFPSQTPNGVIKKQPLDSFRKGEFARVPLIMGFNKNDTNGILLTFLYSFQIPSPYTREEAFRVMKNWIGFDDEQLVKIQSEYALEFATYPSNFTLLSLIFTDALMKHLVVLQADSFAQYGVPAYIYRFDYMPSYANFSFFPPNLLGELGVAHQFELPFVFGQECLFTCDIPFFRGRFSASDRLMQSKIQSYWTQFAKTGNPNDPSNPGDLKWPTWDLSDHPPMLLLTDKQVDIDYALVNDSHNVFWSQYPPLTF